MKVLLSRGQGHLFEEIRAFRSGSGRSVFRVAGYVEE